MPKQEYKILEFHGGSNTKFDPRDIGDNQNVFSSLSVRNPGRLTKEGDAKNLYDKTDINGATIADITTASGGFEKGYGLFSFSHDYSMESTPTEVDTDFVVINDDVGIDIYDANQTSDEWQNDKFKLGSRTGAVKPEYYNVDGALRVCDSNFLTSDVNIDTDAVIEKNDVILTTESGTIATGSIIQIEQEIMYVTSGSSSGTSITVIRGFANTKIARHLTNQDIFYVNVPKYFGHIKHNRLSECDTPVAVNTWVEDIQTPQPPNNTRKSDGATGTLANSAGIQSLRVYDIIEGSTANYPAESEKVVLEFGQSAPDIGIVTVSAASNDTITITTKENHGLAENETIIISGTRSDISTLAGEHEIKSVTSTTFDIVIEGTSQAAVDFNDSGEQQDASGKAAHTSPNTVKLTIANTELPATGTYFVHLSGETGVTSYNGIKLATAINTSNLFFNDVNADDIGSEDGTIAIQQLLGVVSIKGEDSIDEGLKRKWNFAMSFTYDGPAQEVQESLLTQGHSIVPSKQNNGVTANTLKTAISSTGTTSIDVDDSSVFTANESIIMIDSEQMLITSITDADTVVVTRGFNNTAKDGSIAEDSQIFEIKELTPAATVDWTDFTIAPKCVIKSVYGYGTDEKSWNARINGFKIYMRDVTDGDASKEFRLFSEVNFNKGTYTIFAADDSELILEQPATHAIATLTTGTTLKIKPIDTYLSENLFTEQTIIDAQYKVAEVVGRRVYIGNVRQGGRTYPDRMLKSPVNKFDTFPETNYIDVAVGDGDSITALKSFGDRLLQFKKNKVYIINIGGEAEFLEAEYNNAGIEFPSQITKTNNGIAWINKAGLWFFDGKELENLTKFTYDGSFGIGSTNLTSPKIGYDSINDRVIFAPNISSSYVTVWYIYDLTLKAFQSAYLSQLFPFSANANYFTNMINDSNGDLVVGYVDGGSSSKTELNFYTWSNSDTGHQVYPNTSSLWLSKDIDFGSPGIRKKVYKVYITYKCSGHSGVKVEYSTDGGTSLSGFSTSASTNYSIGSLENTSGAWAVAELKPSSSINNIKSMQLSFLLNPVHTGTATGGSSTTIGLASHSASDGDYVNYNIYI